MTIKLVERVHRKVVIGDEELLCIGSFNWFSASRAGDYVNYDASIVYRGNNLQEEIQIIYTNLEKRRLKEKGEAYRLPEK